MEIIAKAEKNKLSLYNFIKRIFDIVISVIAIIFLVPISIIIKILFIISKDFGSIFFIQERIGKDGKIFKMYKYRTMRINAEEELIQILKNNKKLDEEYKLNKKLRYDPRVTKFGKFLRKSSIDELPQFINVLKGEMSFVGPRPYLLAEKEEMKEYYYEITSVKPGITGKWQVSGRNNVSFQDRIRIDNNYCKNKNLVEDFKILLLTIVKVIIKEGAN